MGTKTIGIKEDVYERLKAQKRPDESFTDLMNRLLDESTDDWRDGFGTLSTADAKALEEAVAASREEMSDGLAKRQQEAFKELADVGDETDETP